MREKLVELLNIELCPIVCIGSECSYFDSERCYDEKLADHLIANNVVVREKGSHVKRAVSKTYSVNGELISVQYKTFCPFCGLVCDTLFCAYCGADMRRGEEHESD